MDRSPPGMRFAPRRASPGDQRSGDLLEDDLRSNLQYAGISGCAQDQTLVSRGDTLSGMP